MPLAVHPGVLRCSGARHAACVWSVANDGRGGPGAAGQAAWCTDDDSGRGGQVHALGAATQVLFGSEVLHALTALLPPNPIIALNKI